MERVTENVDEADAKRADKAQKADIDETSNKKARRSR